MKTILNSSGIILLLIAVSISCKKDIPIQRVVSTNNSPNNTIQINTAPVAKAGLDIKIKLPKNFTVLQGDYYDAEENVQKVEWTKVSGPDSCFVNDKFSLKTGVSNLKEGIYQFELTVTDKMDLYGKDTITVEVEKADISLQEVIVGDHEITFKNLVWISPWSNAVEVKNIHSYIPVGTPVKVFIKRDNTAEWKVAEDAGKNNGSNNPVYEYFIETRPSGGGMYTYGSLYIFYWGMDINDTPDVKVQF